MAKSGVTMITGRGIDRGHIIITISRSFSLGFRTTKKINVMRTIDGVIAMTEGDREQRLKLWKSFINSSGGIQSLSQSSCRKAWSCGSLPLLILSWNGISLIGDGWRNYWNISHFAKPSAVAVSRVVISVKQNWLGLDCKQEALFHQKSLSQPIIFYNGVISKVPVSKSIQSHPRTER